MATYRRRGKKGHWYVEVKVNGVRKAKTFTFKSDGNKWAREMESTLTTVDSVSAAFERYILEECPKHKGERWEILRLNKLLTELPGNKKLCDLVPNDLATWRNNRLLVVTPSTVKREMNLINQVFNVALREWGWLKTNPLLIVKKPLDTRPRRRGIPNEVIQPILSNLSYQSDTQAVLKKQQVGVAFLFAIETAMRLGEILSLTIGDIDLKNKVVTVVDSKNKDTRQVPLSSVAVNLLHQLPLLNNRSSNQLIFNITPGSASSTFRKAKHCAGYSDVHFHDSRSEGLTRLAKVFSVIELARIVGHRSPASLMIYYAPSISDLAKKLN